MIPILFETNERAFNHYGLGEVPFTKAEVTRERNGEYTFYGEINTDDPMAKELVEGRWLKADAGYRTKNQTFEIVRVFGKSGKVMQVYANHISYQLITSALPPIFKFNNVTAQAVLQAFVNNLVSDFTWSAWSDIDVASSIDLKISQYETPRRLLGGVSGSVLDVFGGEYEFDNTIIRLHKNYGRKSPTTIEYGRNITDAEVDRDINSTFTSIRPYAIKQATDSVPEIITIIDEPYLDCENYVSGRTRKIKPVDFSSSFKQDETHTKEKLKNLAIAYMKRNNFGVPNTNIKLSYLDLSTTLDYQTLKHLEEVELCDTLPIFYSKLRITDQNAKVVKIVFDTLRSMNKSIEVGVIGKSYSQKVLEDMNSKISEIASSTSNIANQLQQWQMSADGRTRIFYDVLPTDVEFIVGDTLMIKNGIYSIIKIFDGVDWITIVDEETYQKEMEIKFKALDDKSKELKDELDASAQKVNEALEVAGASKNLAETAKNVADSAIASAVELSEKVSEHTIEINEINGSLLEKWTRADVESFVQTSISNEAGAINKALVEVKGSFPKISGIRNLLKGTRDGTIANVQRFITQDKLGDLTIISGSGANGHIHLIDTEMTIEAKDDGYIGSFFAKADTPMNVQLFLTGGQIKSVETSAGTKSTFGDGAINIPITTTWERYWVKWTNTPIAKKLRFIVRNSAPTTLYMAGVALYAGSLSIDHMDAPEDIVTTVNFNKVMETPSLYERIIGYQTDGQNAIARHVMTSQLFQNEISKLQTDTNNLIRGTASMLKGAGIWATGTFYHSGVGTSTTIDVSDSPIANVSKAMRLVRDSNVGETGFAQAICYLRKGRYYYSAWVKGNIGTQFIMQPYWSSANSEVQRFTFTIEKTGWQEYSVFSDNPVDDTRNIGYIYIAKNMPAGTTIDVMGQMLVMSNFRVPYSQAYEDLETITTSKITQLSDSISLGLFNQKGLVSGAQFGQNGVYIKGSLINLDGTVNMNDAFIRKLLVDTASVNTLNALAGRFGSIISSYIDASKITTGLLTAIEGAFISGNGAVRIARNEVKITGGTTDVMTLNSSGLHFRDNDNELLGWLGRSNSDYTTGIYGKIFNISVAPSKYLVLGYGIQNGTYSAALTLNGGNGNISLHKHVTIEGDLHVARYTQFYNDVKYTNNQKMYFGNNNYINFRMLDTYCIITFNGTSNGLVIGNGGAQVMKNGTVYNL